MIVTLLKGLYWLRRFSFGPGSFMAALLGQLLWKRIALKTLVLSDGRALGSTALLVVHHQSNVLILKRFVRSLLLLGLRLVPFVNELGALISGPLEAHCC